MGVKDTCHVFLLPSMLAATFLCFSNIKSAFSRRECPLPLPALGSACDLLEYDPSLCDLSEGDLPACDKVHQSGVPM